MSIEEQVVASARAYLGPPPTRFHHQGRSKEHGIDCIGLVLGGFEGAGAPVECPRADYERQAHGDELEVELAKRFDRVTDGSERIGDILVFAFVKPAKFPRGVPQHLALRTDKGMIHCWSGAKLVAEHAITLSWKNRLVSVWRLREKVAA